MPTQNIIRRLLVANRGEVVSRIAGTATRLGIRTIGMFDEDSRDLPYVRDVDSAVRIGDSDLSNAFLDIKAILDVAAAQDADAVHPGYGFLSENADFAQACLDAGLIWVGPSPEAMRTMSDKAAAKAVARRAGVPVLEDQLLDDPIPATLSVVPEFPIIVKPVGGGGGKGMHVATSREELDELLTQANREAVASFGDGRLLLERFIEDPRHVEVQVAADSFRHVITLGDRDCTVQRRHQKVIEEAPAPRLTDVIRVALHRAAVALTQEIGYLGIGTLEFLVAGDEIFFLEMNTRLQVEHAVSEEVLGIDLVQLQLDIANGLPIPSEMEDLSPHGHAMEVRLYAEDPALDYLPSPGTISRLEVPAGADVRWESAVETGSQVSARFDPMIAKLISRGRTRDEAAAVLAHALDGLVIHGITTNRLLLARVLRDPAFLDGNYSTRFLEQRPELARPSEDRALRTANAIVVAVWRIVTTADGAADAAGFGWSNVGPVPQDMALQDAEGLIQIRLIRTRPDAWEAQVDDVSHQVRAGDPREGSIAVEIDGMRREYAVTQSRHGLSVSSVDGESTLSVDVDGPVDGQAHAMVPCRAGIPGTVIAVLVLAGQQVSLGDPLVTIEAMKMEHTYRADMDAVVAEVLVTAGEPVAYQQLLIDLAPPEGDAP